MRVLILAIALVGSLACSQSTPIAPSQEFPNSGMTQVKTAITVAVYPSFVRILLGSSKQFTATVTGASNPAVTWSINPVIGSITSTGLYTAPTTMPSQTVQVIATSVEDPTKSGTATVAFRPPVSPN